MKECDRIPKRKKTRIENNKTKLFKILQNLDRKISEIDNVLKIRDYLYPNDKATIKLKERRLRLDQKRKIARLDRINYGRN